MFLKNPYFMFHVLKKGWEIGVYLWRGGRTGIFWRIFCMSCHLFIWTWTFSMIKFGCAKLCIFYTKFTFFQMYGLNRHRYFWSMSLIYWYRSANSYFFLVKLGTCQLPDDNSIFHIKFYQISTCFFKPWVLLISVIVFAIKAKGPSPVWKK